VVPHGLLPGDDGLWAKQVHAHRGADGGSGCEGEQMQRDDGQRELQRLGARQSTGAGIEAEKLGRPADKKIQRPFPPPSKY